MRKLLTSTALLAVLSACASTEKPPSFMNAAQMPAPVNAEPSGGHVLPLIQDLNYRREEKTTSSGTKRPSRSEIRGNTWIPEYDPYSDYEIPVQTTNATGTRTVQQVLLTSDLPSGQGSCSTKGVNVAPLEYGFAATFKPGAPVGTEMMCVVQFGGRNVKIVFKAVNRRSISEVRFEGRDEKRKGSFPQGVCSDANYKVSKLVRGGPLGACTIVDASGANTATYIKLPASAGSVPIVQSDDGATLRMARPSFEKLPSGGTLLRVQGSASQIALTYQSGETVYITRGQ